MRAKKSKWRLAIRFRHKINKADKAMLNTDDEDLDDYELERKMEIEDKIDQAKERRHGKGEQKERPTEDIPLPGVEEGGGDS